METPPFAQALTDPSLVSGIYNTCDQWCMYCPATHRCLAYRCDTGIGSGRKDIIAVLPPGSSKE